MMRVAVLSDIGQPVYHVGDEAIAHGARAQLRARGVRPLLLTRDVRHTRAYFGPTDAAPTLPFPWPPAERERRLAAIERHLDGDDEALAGDDPARGFLATIRSVDAVLIAGGGNLNSQYGWLMYERMAAVLAAGRLGKPVAITGQTLGPQLTAHDREQLTAALAACSVIALRERHSVALAGQLWPGDPRVVGGLDDAAGWRLGAPEPSAGGGPRVLATFAPAPSSSREEDAGRLAALLDAFAERTGADVALLPHMAHPGRADGDLAFHAAIAAASASGRLRACPLPTASEAADAVVGADLVITTRYHPAVFATARGVPVFALAPDHYADVRIDGALGHHGLGGWTVPLAALATGEAAEALAALWADRDRVRAHLHAHHDRLLGAHRRRWDELVRALAGEEIAPQPWESAPALTPPDAIASARAVHLPALAAQFEQLQAWLERDRAASYDED